MADTPLVVGWGSECNSPIYVDLPKWDVGGHTSREDMNHMHDPWPRKWGIYKHD
jgi:hypothetical protein